jgi:Domain of unknown function DUF302
LRLEAIVSRTSVGAIENRPRQEHERRPLTLSHPRERESPPSCAVVVGAWVWTVGLAALDMPLKVLVWSDHGQTRVTYTAPTALAVRYGLSEELAARLAGTDGLTDALVDA